MDSILSFGKEINVLGILLIVIICELIKRLDKKFWLKPYYAFIPFVVGLPVAYLVTEFISIKQLILDYIIFTSIAAYAYDIIKSIIDRFINKKADNV